MSVELTEERKEELEKNLTSLKDQMTGDIFADGEIMDKVLEIEIELGITKINKDSPQSCIGCGS